MVFSGGCCQTAVRSKNVAGHSGLDFSSHGEMNRFIEEKVIRGTLV